LKKSVTFYGFASAYGFLDGKRFYLDQIFHLAVNPLTKNNVTGLTQANETVGLFNTLPDRAVFNLRMGTDIPGQDNSRTNANADVTEKLTFLLTAQRQ